MLVEFTACIPDLVNLKELTLSLNRFINYFENYSPDVMIKERLNYTNAFADEVHERAYFKKFNTYEEQEYISDFKSDLKKVARFYSRQQRFPRLFGHKQFLY